MKSLLTMIFAVQVLILGAWFGLCWFHCMYRTFVLVELNPPFGTLLVCMAISTIFLGVGGWLVIDAARRRN